MKKLFALGLSILILMSNPFIAFASENSEFYAYSTSTSEFDAYAKKELSTHIFTYYGLIDNSLKLGSGINVFGKEIPTVLYPIWKGNQIVATFNVVYYNGQYSGSYSEGNVEQLNHARKIATHDNPIKLIKTQDHFVYVVNEVAYDMTEGVGQIIYDINLPDLSGQKLIKVDTANKLEHIQVNTRAAASWNLPWNPSEHYPDSNIYCHAYSLSPILRSMGYSQYTVQYIIDAFDGAPGKDITLLNPYLLEEGFNTDYSPTGSMDLTSAVNMIYYNRKHILVGLRVLTPSSTANHYGTITGYSSVNGNYTYKIYEPTHNGVNGKTTIPASSKTFTNSDGSTFVWDAGYITNIR